MSILRLTAATASLMALVACNASAPPGIAPLFSNAPDAPVEQALAASCTGDAALAARMTGAVNATRSAEGKIVLAPSERLDQIAQSHACDMAQRGRLDVAGSNGSNVVDRARAVGYPACGVVQLVAIGPSPEGVVGTWLTQPPQREQLLGQLSFEVGSGAVRGSDGRVWHSVVLGNNCR